MAIRSRSPWFFAALAIALLAGPPAAWSVTITSATRTVSVSGNTSVAVGSADEAGPSDSDFGTGSTTSAATSGAFTESVSNLTTSSILNDPQFGDASAQASADADQDSLIGTTSWSGTASVFAALSVETNGGEQNNAQADANAQSIFDLFFSLPSPHTFLLTGNLVAPIFGPGVLLFLCCDTLSNDIVNFGSTTPVMSASGLLPTGSYQFHVEVAADIFASVLGAVGTSTGSDGGSWTFDFQLTPVVATVPEPSSLLLLASGLIGIACSTARRSRRRR